VYSQLLITFASRHGLLRVAGVLDDTGRRQLRRRLEEAIGAGCLRLDVDCAQVRHVAPETLRDLTTARSELERRGGELVVRTPSLIFSRAVRLAGREDLLASPARRPGRGRASADSPARIRPGRRKHPLQFPWRRRSTAALLPIDSRRERPRLRPDDR
jgi:hypothetical protein